MFFSIYCLLIFLKIDLTTSQRPKGPKLTGYNQDMAKLLYLLCYESYYSNPGKCITSQTDLLIAYKYYNAFTSVCDNRGNKCTYFLLYSPIHKVIIITFSGSKTNDQVTKQAVEAFKNGVNFFNLGKVNRYYMNAQRVLWKSIISIIGKGMFADYKIILTGHSLGAALASLTAIRLDVEGVKKGHMITLYTFGEPRIGSLEFAINFDKIIKESYRVIFGKDIVPHFPPCHKEKLKKRKYSKKNVKTCSTTDLNSPYHHGTEIWYPVDTNPQSVYVECLGKPKNEDNSCSNSINFYFYKFSSYMQDHGYYFKYFIHSHMYLFEQRDC